MASTLHDRRSALAAIASASVAIGAVALVPSSWSERFDPATWIERWYRAGHGIGFTPNGRPFLLESMKTDDEEASGKALRGELDYLGNRHVLRRYLAGSSPSRPGMACGYATGAA